MRWTNKTSQNPSSLKRTSSSIAKPSNARLVWIKTCQNHQSSCPTSSTISSKCPRKRDLSVQASALKIKEVIFRRSTTEKLFETWNGDVIWNRLKGSVYFKGTPSERRPVRLKLIYQHLILVCQMYDLFKLKIKFTVKKVSSFQVSFGPRNRVGQNLTYILPT